MSLNFLSLYSLNLPKKVDVKPNTIRVVKRPLGSSVTVTIEFVPYPLSHSSVVKGSNIIRFYESPLARSGVLWYVPNLLAIPKSNVKLGTQVSSKSLSLKPKAINGFRRYLSTQAGDELKSLVIFKNVNTSIIIQPHKPSESIIPYVKEPSDLEVNYSIAVIPTPAKNAIVLTHPHPSKDNVDVQGDGYTTRFNTINKNDEPKSELLYPEVLGEVIQSGDQLYHYSEENRLTRIETLSCNGVITETINIIVDDYQAETDILNNLLINYEKSEYEVSGGGVYRSIEVKEAQDDIKLVGIDVNRNLRCMIFRFEASKLQNLPMFSTSHEIILFMYTALKLLKLEKEFINFGHNKVLLSTGSGLVQYRHGKPLLVDFSLHNNTQVNNTQSVLTMLDNMILQGLKSYYGDHYPCQYLEKLEIRVWNMDHLANQRIKINHTNKTCVNLKTGESLKRSGLVLSKGSVFD